MKKYVIALDQGTTSSRAIIFDKDQNILDISQKKFILMKDGWSIIQWKYGPVNMVFYKKCWLNLI